MLRAADLTDARLLGADLTGVDLHGARLRRVAAIGARLPALAHADTLGAALDPAPVLQLRPAVSGVYAVAFDDRGELVASGGVDGVVRVWGVGDGVLLRELSGHRGAVWSVGFSPDGTRLAAAGDDRVVRIWAASTGRLLAMLLPLDDGGWATLTPDLRYKLHGIPNGEFWYVVDMCRFEPGEADEYLGLQRLPAGYPIIGPA